MVKNSRKMNVPNEFHQFIDGLADQVAVDLGMPKNKTQTMRLLASTYKDKIIYRGKKFDIKLF